MSKLTQEEALSKLCYISSLVGQNVFYNQAHHDCFCGEKKEMDDGFQFDDCVIDFIERAVNKEINHLDNLMD